jgi:hypothetical protein
MLEQGRPSDRGNCASSGLWRAGANAPQLHPGPGGDAASHKTSHKKCFRTHRLSLIGRSSCPTRAPIITGSTDIADATVTSLLAAGRDLFDIQALQPL